MKPSHLPAQRLATLAGVALLAVMACLPLHGATAADQVQLLRKAQPDTSFMLPYTTYAQEELAITRSLPCKWISKDGRLGPSYGSGRYDFLCKGGQFATLTLYLDKAGSASQGVGSVRLIYRDWPPNTHPNAAEAQVAQQFLEHVAGRFVPQGLAADVVGAFWTTTPRSWRQPGLNIAYDYVKPKGSQGFALRKLTVVPTTAPQPARPAQPAAVTPAQALTKPLPQFQPQPQTQVIIYGADGKPVTTRPVITPTDAGLRQQLPQAQPVAPTLLQTLPQPGNLPPLAPLPTPALVVPPTAPAGVPQSTLQPATAAELNTAPEPASKAIPAAPPPPASSFVPTVEDLIEGGRRAPSNFDVYNRASELTKDVETKAQTTSVEAARVTASKPVSPTAAPSLQPLPVPSPQASAPGALVTDDANRAPSTLQPAALPSSLPANYQGPRQPQRPLPQLQFVPKAEPLPNPTEVIQFEDESSAL